MAQKIAELRAEAMRVGAEARSVVEGLADDATAEVRQEAERRFAELMGKRDDLAARADQLAELDRMAAEEESWRASEERSQREGRRPGAGEAEEFSGGAETRGAERTGSAEYRSAFAQFMSRGGMLADLEPEARSLLIAETRAMTGGATDGGVLVPSEVARQVSLAMAAHGPMMDATLVTVVNSATGAGWTLPTVDDTGKQMDDHAAGDDLLNDGSGDFVVDGMTLQAWSQTTPWIKVGAEIFEDAAVSWEELIGRLIGARAGRTANARLTIGTGTGMPKGFANVLDTGHTASAQTAITFDDVRRLEHSVDPAYRIGQKVAFQLHDQSKLALRLLKGTDGKFLWKDGDLTTGEPDRLDGFRVATNQAMAQIAAGTSPLAFGNWAEWYSRSVGGVRVGVDRNSAWPNVKFAGHMRIDGGVGQKSAIKLMKMAA